MEEQVIEISSHQAAFFAICVITQIKINNKEISLFECESYDDSFKNYTDNNTYYKDSHLI